MRRKKIKRNIKNYKGKLFIISSLLIVFSIIIISNDFGLIQLIDLKKTKHSLQDEIQILSAQQNKLNEDISNIQTNTEYIEKIAREKFMMAKPGEKIFRVIEYKQIDK